MACRNQRIRKDTQSLRDSCKKQKGSKRKEFVKAYSFQVFLRITICTEHCQTFEKLDNPKVRTLSSFECTEIEILTGFFRTKIIFQKITGLVCFIGYQKSTTNRRLQKNVQTEKPRVGLNSSFCLKV